MSKNSLVPESHKAEYRLAPRQLFNDQYWEKRLADNWGLHGVGYISYGTHYNRWLYKVRRHVFDREIRKLPVDWKQADVLDVGSGTGYWIETWKALGVRSIAGSDVTRIAVERLRNSYPGLQITRLDISGSLEEQGVQKKYDVVSAFDVLFHITDDEGFQGALANIGRLLRTGGYFIFSDNFLHRGEIRTDYQVSRTLKEIRGVLSSVGFKIIRRAPMFVLMNTPVDSPGPWPVRFWRLMMLPVRAMPLVGFFYGAALYPAEVCLTRFLRESPTTELMICQKAPVDPIA